jgi:hypothetical protein
MTYWINTILTWKYTGNLLPIYTRMILKIHENCIWHILKKTRTKPNFNMKFVCIHYVYMQNFDKGKRKNKEKNHKVQCLVSEMIVNLSQRLRNQIENLVYFNKYFNRNTVLSTLRVLKIFTQVVMLQTINQNKNFIIIGCAHSYVNFFWIIWIISRFHTTTPNILNCSLAYAPQTVRRQASLFCISLETQSSTSSYIQFTHSLVLPKHLGLKGS